MAKPYLIAGLDIGSSVIKALVVQKKLTESKLEVLAMVEEASVGVRRGVVINPNEVSVILERIFKKIKEQISPLGIDSVYVNINGCHISSTTSRGLISIARADQKISQTDIERVLEAAQTFSLPFNREILEVFPKEFIIDGEKNIKEPLGLQGIRLEVEILALTGFSPYIKNLTNAILGANLQINDLILSPIASSYSVLTPREKELGVCLLDIGAGTTGLAVFEEGNLIYTDILPIGSGHITNDIAFFLKTNIDIAERIKLEFGNLSPENDKKERVKISEGESLVFSHKQLAKVISVRVLEIFKEANQRLKKISKQGLLPAGIVLTGGGAKLPKIKELAKKEFRLFCRIGKPNGFSPSLNDSRFAVVCGLVLKNNLEEEIIPSKNGIIKKIKKIFKIFIP